MKKVQSEEWKRLEEIYRKEIERAKNDFYRKKIKNLRRENARRWHQELKKITTLKVL